MKEVPKEAFWKQILVLLTVYINVSLMGGTNAWSIIAVYFFRNDREVSANSSQLALIISLPHIARLVFAIPGGMLVDRFGRKKFVFISSAFYFFGFLILSLYTQVEAIYLGRFLLGIAIALVNATAMTCIGEIASPEIRAKLTGVYQQFMMIGRLFQVIFLAFHSSYFIIQYCNLLLSLLPFIFFYWTQETPDYLISICKYDNAKKNLIYIRPKYSEVEIDTEFEKTKKYIENEQERKKKIDWLKFINSAEIRTPIITLFLLNFFAFGTGFYTAMCYITSIIPSNSYIENKYFPFLHSCISIFALLILPMYIEKFPRRVFFISGTLLMILFNLLQTVTYIFYLKFENDIFKWVYIFSFAMTGFVTCCCIQTMVSVSKSEILPQSVRGLGNAVTVLSHSLITVLTVFAFDYLWLNFGVYYNFILYTLSSFILLILIYYRLPESRGKLLADIQTEQNCNQ